MSSRRAARKATKVVISEISKTTKLTKAPARKRGKPAGAGIDDNAAEKSPYFVPESNLQPGTKCDKQFYDQDAISLSKALLGKVLCRKLPDTGEIVKGTIVETEAYPGKSDAASRSSKGVPTEASMPMFMEHGTAFVYMTYGIYHCFNVSSKDYGGASLFRAVEVHEDYEVMHELRQAKRKILNKGKNDSQAGKPVKRLKQHELADGPSKLCLAFNITKDLCNKIDISTSTDLWVEVGSDEKYNPGQFEMGVSRRIGIDNSPPESRNQLYRFFVKDNTSVSKAKFKKEEDIKKKRKKRA